MTPMGAITDRPPLRDEHGQLIEDEDGFLLPPHRTFASVWNTISRTYPYRWDEALKHSSQNALAMFRDTFLLGCLFERIYQLAELPWHLEPENSKDSRQTEIVQQETSIVKATDRWIQFCTQIAWATWYGRYANQVLWRAKEVNGKQRLCATKHAPVNGDKVQFGWDGTPRVMVGYQWISQNVPPGSKYANPNYFDNYPERDALINVDPAKPIVYADRAPMLILRDPLWRDRFVIHKHMCIDADYFEGEMAGAVHGVGLRSMIYWFWWLRDEMIGWAVNHLKKIGVGGILIFYFDENNANSKTAAESAAKNAGERYAIAMPRPRGSSRDVEGAQLLPFNEAGVQSLTNVVQDYFERHIERLIIGQSLSSKAEATGLGSAVAGLHADTKYKILKFDADNLADTFTEDFVRVIQKWNFPQAGFRTRFVFDVPDPGSDGKIGLATQLFATGMALKAQNLRTLAGFEKPESDDEIVSQAQSLKQQSEIQNQAQQQQMQLQGQQQQQQAQTQQEQKAAEQQASAVRDMQGKQLDQQHQLTMAKQAQEHELAKLQQQHEQALKQKQTEQEFQNQQALDQHGRAIEMETGRNPLFTAPGQREEEEPEPDRDEMLQIIEQVLGPDWAESDESPADRLGLGGEAVDEILAPPEKAPEQQPAQVVPEIQSGEQPVAGPTVAGFDDDGRMVEYKSEHAPAGGVTINGKEFVGGQFIPAADMAKATKEECAHLEAKKQGIQTIPQPAAQPQAQPEAAPMPEGAVEPRPESIPEPSIEDQQLEHALVELTDDNSPVIPPQQMQSLMDEAAQRVPPEHQVPVFQAIQRYTKLTTYDYRRAAGRAYASAGKARALGQINQDVYDAAACKLIDKYRWRQYRIIGKKAEIPPVSRGVLDFTRWAQRKTKKHGGAVAADVMRRRVEPALGTGKAEAAAAIAAARNPQEKAAIEHKIKIKRRVQEAGIDIAKDAIVAFINLGVSKIPHVFSKTTGHPIPPPKHRRGYADDRPPVLYAFGEDEPLPDPRDWDEEREAMEEILAAQNISASDDEIDEMLDVLEELFSGPTQVARPITKSPESEEPEKYQEAEKPVEVKPAEPEVKKMPERLDDSFLREIKSLLKELVQARPVAVAEDKKPIKMIEELEVVRDKEGLIKKTVKRIRPADESGSDPEPITHGTL